MLESTYMVYKQRVKSTEGVAEGELHIDPRSHL